MPPIYPQYRRPSNQVRAIPTADSQVDPLSAKLHEGTRSTSNFISTITPVWNPLDQDLAPGLSWNSLSPYFYSPHEPTTLDVMVPSQIREGLHGFFGNALPISNLELEYLVTLPTYDETYSWDYVFLRGLLWACSEENSGLGFLSVQDFADHHSRLDKVEPLLQQAIWDHLRQDFDTDLSTNSAPWPAEYSDYLNQLESLGPLLPLRIQGVPAALRLMEHHRHFRSGEGTGPLTVYIAPTADYNGAFTSDGGFPLLDRLLDMNQGQVLYFEAGSEAQMMQILEQVRETSGQDIDVLIVAGHGTPFSLALGNAQVHPDDSPEGEGQYLTPEDFALGDFAGLETILADEGEVILYSCSTGAGEEHLFNLANAFATALPGRRILSPQADTNIEAIFPGSEKYPLLIKWRGTGTYLAYQSPGAPRQFPLRQIRVLSRTETGNGPME